MSAPETTRTEKLDTCGCCKSRTPKTRIYNRSGLPAISYRIGTHSTFLRRMMENLTSDIVPERKNISVLTTRSPDDPAIALMDSWAVVADVLTFYQERIANEGYLRTATERRSVLELARAIGYELSPGVAASAYLAFMVEDKEGAPGRATIEKGLKVMSVPGQDEKPQTFETGEKIEARKEWNILRPRLTVPQEIKWGNTQLYIAGINTRLSPGDAILLVGEERGKHNSQSERWDFRIIQTVTPYPEKNYTVVTWEPGLGHENPHVDPADKPGLFAFRQRSALFGYNAPDWRAMAETVKKAYDPTYDPENPGKEWPDFEIKIGKERLFDWNLIPQDTGEREKLKEFLIETFGVNWVDSATVIKTLGGGSINVSTGINSLYLKLNYKKTWVTLAIDDGRTDEFIAKSENGKLNIYGRNTIDLDAVYPKILAGTWVVLMKPGYVELYLAKDVDAGSQTDFTLTAKTTRIKPDTVNHLTWFSRRGTVVFAQSEPLELTVRPLTDPVQGKEIVLNSRVEDLEQDRKLIVSGRRMRVKIADSAGKLYLVSSADSSKKIELMPGEMLYVIELPSPDGNGVLKWHLVNRDGFDGFVDIAPDTKYLARIGDQVKIKTGDLSLISEDGREGIRLKKGDALDIQEPLFSFREGRLQWHLANDRGFKGYVAVEPDKIILAPSSKDDATLSEVALIESVSELEYSAVTLKDPLANVYDRETVYIHANVALATHGETVDREVLGNGEGSKANQHFPLKKYPLTYISAHTPTGTENTLSIYVNDVEWKETRSMYDLDANSQNYIVRIGDEGKTEVIFGDGKKGARLPTGQENIVATYRSGIGPEGEVGANKLILLQKRPFGIREVTNPLPASGAAAPEKLEDARTNAPFTVLTLERIVSLKDYEDFARAFAGIGKAQAVEIRIGETRVAHITVAGSNGKTVDPGSNLHINLVDAINSVRLPMQKVIVDTFQPCSFNLEAKVKIGKKYIAAKVLASIKTALQGFFSFDKRNFGQPVTSAEIITVIQSVDGVIYTDLDKLYKTKTCSDAGSTDSILTAGTAFLGEDNKIKKAELLLINPSGITLTEM